MCFLKTKTLLAFGMVMLSSQFGCDCGSSTAQEDSGKSTDAAVADGSAPDTILPDIATADTTVPDTGMPDTTAPDTQVADGTRPDTTLPDAAQPDAVQPDAAQPDVSPADTAVPDTTIVPDAFVDDSWMPEDAYSGPPTVTIVSPTSPHYTRQLVEFVIEITGGTPDDVEILSNGVVIVPLSPPYEFITWNVGPQDEGEYIVTVRATFGDDTYHSNPVSVFVDKTAPTVISRSPLPGSSVRLGVPVVAGFSEPLAPASITDTSVSMASNEGALTIDRQLQESNLRLNLTTTPAVPNNLTVTLTTEITDRAGNALVLPSGAWTWQLTEVQGWQQLGGPLDLVIEEYANNPTLGYSSTGQLFAAWGEWDVTYGNYSIHVKKWDGLVWQELGDQPIDVSAPANSQVPMMKIDSAGYPVVTWYEGHYVYVKRWTGSTWLQVGPGLLDNNCTDFDHCFANNPALDLDSNDNPVVTWNEWDSHQSGTIDDIFVSRWDGSSWLSYGTGPLDVAATHSTGHARIVLDQSDNPIVAFDESNSNSGSTTKHDVYVKRWNGSQWTVLGDGPIELNAGNHIYSPEIAINTSNNPVLAFYHFEYATAPTSHVYVMEWTGSSWDTLGGGPVTDQDSHAPEFAMDGDDPVVVLGLDDNDMVVYRLNAGNWQQVGTSPLDIDVTKSAWAPAIVLDGVGNPIVGWNEATDTESINVYVKQYY